MKDIRKLNLNSNLSIFEQYNQLNEKSPTTPFEAICTIEALNNVLNSDDPIKKELLLELKEES